MRQKKGKRFLSVDSHIHMMAAAQSFISGAISKTINMPNDATIEDCQKAYELSWSLGVKANALYRDGSKLSQPLAAALVEDDEEAEEILASGSPHEKAVTLAEKIIEKVVIKEVARGREKLPERRKAIRRKPSSVVTKCICAPVNTRMAIWAKSSSTCTRKALASGR